MDIDMFLMPKRAQGQSAKENIDNYCQWRIGWGKKYPPAYLLVNPDEDNCILRIKIKGRKAVLFMAEREGKVYVEFDYN